MRCILVAVLLLVAKAAHADGILGLTHQATLRSSTPTSVFSVNFNYGVGWHFTATAADVRHVFVASPDTVGQYPILDWDYLQRSMTGESPFMNVLCTFTTCHGFSTAEMHKLDTAEWTSYFTAPDNFFHSLDRIEFELISLAPGKVDDIDGAMVQWRFYGEPISTPGPSSLLLALLGFVAAANTRRRQHG